MNARKNHQDRQALLDRLERKYIKKVQLQAFRHETEQLKHSLDFIRGKNVANLRDVLYL